MCANLCQPTIHSRQLSQSTSPNRKEEDEGQEDNDDRGTMSREVRGGQRVSECGGLNWPSPHPGHAHPQANDVLAAAAKDVEIERDNGAL